MTAPTTPSPERQPADAGGGLLPCPWCGGELYVSVQDIDNFIGHVECGGCDMRGPISEWKYEDPEEAKADAVERWNAAWNRRSPTPQAQPDARAVEALQRIAEVSGNRASRGFNETGRLDRINDIANQALSAPAADDGWRPTHRHRGGMECEVIGTAYVQTVTGLCDYDEVTIYREEDGTMWARGSDEFNDGRFTALHPAAPTDEVGKS